MSAWNVIAYLDSLLKSQPVTPTTPLPMGNYVGGVIVGPANPLPVAGPMGWYPVYSSDTFDRPNNTTSYVVGQLITNSTSASVAMTLAAGRVIDVQAMARRVSLSVNDVTPWTGAVVRVHFLRANPTFTNNDGGNFTGGLTLANYLGSFDVTLDKVGSDVVVGHGTPNTGNEMAFRPVTGTLNIRAVLEARSAVTTPAAQKTFILGVDSVSAG